LPSCTCCWWKWGRHDHCDVCGHWRRIIIAFGIKHCPDCLHDLEEYVSGRRLT